MNTLKMYQRWNKFQKYICDWKVPKLSEVLMCIYENFELDGTSYKSIAYCISNQRKLTKITIDFALELLDKFFLKVKLPLEILTTFEFEFENKTPNYRKMAFFKVAQI